LFLNFVGIKLADGLPYFPNDPQQVERKRHLGNDVVVIVFNDGYDTFSPDVIHSEFNHVFCVVQKDASSKAAGKTRYKIGLTCKIGVQPFYPILETPAVFDKSADLKEFLLVKLINAERTALYGAPEFAKKMTRTRKILLDNIMQKYQE